MASAERTAPPMSKRPSWASLVLGTEVSASPSATAASTPGSTNTHGHVYRSITNADAQSPMIPPAPAKPAHMPTARPRSSGGKVEVMTDSVTGMIIAAATPPPIRATRSMVVELAIAAPRLEPMKRASPAIST
jgi:hypothetical protein